MPPPNLTLRPATPTDASALTTLTFASKRHWNYPEAYFETWKNELTITPEYLAGNIVQLAECDRDIRGYYSIVENPCDRMVGKIIVRRGFWLDHIFVHPAYLRQGIGRLLLEHARQTCRANSIANLFIFSDPYARGFYENAGATYLGDSLSSIAGRLIPIFDLPCSRPSRFA